MIGEVLNNRYEIIEKIGEGGMAEVYKAKCRVLNRFVAIKILKKEFINDETFAEKFEREAQAAASLSHPNIVNVYDVGYMESINGKMPYIVMEYINGKTLKQIIIEKGKLGISETVFYSLQIAGALESAHFNNIIHRDIKPHNIMIDNQNRAKVTDFGIARAVTSSTVTIGSDTLGSVHYISPEQARGAYTDEKSDIYSLGIVMYEMVTGKLPFNAETPVAVALKHIQEKIIPPRDIDDSVSPEIEAIILKCVEKNQSDRYQKMSGLIRDLKNIDILQTPKINKNKIIEDSPTMVIPIIDDKETSDVESFDNIKEEVVNNKKRKKDKKTPILAVLLAFLVVAAIFFAYFILKDSFKSSEVIVPDFRGMQIEEAEEKAEDYDLKLVIRDRIESDEFEEGEIIKQSEGPDTKVKSGTSIDVTISDGGALIRVPSFINQTLDDAISAIEALGLQMDENENKYEYNDNVSVDEIIEQRPNPYTYLSKGDKVSLIISKGKEIKTITMPNLVGQNITAAKNKIKSSGLSIGNVKEEFNSDYPKDVVYFQSYNEGRELEKNTKVDLYVSKGEKPEPELQPDPEPEPEPEPEPIPDPEPEPEPVEDETEFIFQLPTIKDGEKFKEVEVVIKRIKNSNEDEVYNKKKLADGGTIKVILTGEKPDKLQIYFDGIIDEKQTK